MSPNKIYVFEDFRFDPAERRLEKAGAQIAQTPKAFEVLRVLVEARGRAVSKKELLTAVWADTYVDEGTLMQNISTLRRALGDGWIETLPKLGYRFRMPEVVAAPAPRRVPRRVILGAGAAVPAAAGVWLWRSRQAVPAPLSVAVLPVQSLSGEAGDKLVAESLTEEITHALVSTGAVRVVARTSAYRFAAGPRDVRAIARDLKADAVLEGSLRRVDGGYRVTAQLIQGGDGFHSWSRAWNYAKGDVFGVAPEIAAGIAEMVPGRASARAVKPLTENSEALMLFVRASAVNRKVFGGALEEAIVLLQQALALDPGFAYAHALLGHCYASLGFTQQRPPREVYPLAEAAVASAIRIDPETAYAYTVRGDIEQHFRWRWPEAIRAFERSMALDPHSSYVHHYLSHYLLSVGRIEEALRAARRMLELDPMDPEGFAHLAFTQICARDYPAAFRAVELGLKLERNHIPTLAYLRWAAEDSGDFGKALDARRLLSNPPELLRALEAGLAREGEKGYWRALLDFDLASPTRRGRQQTSIAATFARLGDSEQSLAWLERALQARVSWMTYLRINRAYDGLRDDARFRRIVTQVGIPG